MTLQSSVLLDDVAQAQRLVSGLLDLNIEEQHIHIVARNDLSLETLPDAHLLGRSAVDQAAKQGIVMGGKVGLLACTGLVVVAFPSGLALGGGAILTAASANAASFAVWAASVAAAGVPDTELQRSRSAVVDGGKVLVHVVAQDATRAIAVDRLMAALPDAKGNDTHAEGPPVLRRGLERLRVLSQRYLPGRAA